MELFNEMVVRETMEEVYGTDISEKKEIDEIVDELVKRFNVRLLNIDDRVVLSSVILETLNEADRIILAEKLLTEQVLEQREKLAAWSTLTSQTAQIDTGYIAQHLVSLVTQIPGQGMRGKGDDLIDGSEVKSANFLDSLDKKGAVAPRWNFTAVTPDVMEGFLEYENLYLVSMDLTPDYRMRFRIWKVDVNKHSVLRDRYKEWMEVLGYPKFENTERRASVNFQLFPPRSESLDDYARHGNGRKGGFERLVIHLENTEGSKKIFHAEENNQGKIKVIQFNEKRRA